MATSTLTTAAEAELAVQNIEADDFRDAVIAGLSAPEKSIPSRFFYDERGSQLFEQITELDEYYPTRAEMEILAACREELAEIAAEQRALVEYGSGSSRKVRVLLEALGQIDVYAPIDISPEMLSAEAEAVRADFPDLAVSPIHADFTGEVELPLHVRRRGPLAFFPGSTIGNFTPRDAHGFLQRIRRSVGPGGLLLIGADRKKEVEVLLAAYDDAKGVTAAFNLNLLHRINRELDGTFDPGGFAHEARYDEDHGRIEMHLVSQKEQSATVGRHRFSFARGESIHTENSYKYAPSEFALLARTAGWELVRMWGDPNARFGVYLLRAG